MDREQELNKPTPTEIEIERLKKYEAAPCFRGDRYERPSGVLLSDQIEYYCKYYKLLDPCSPENIMAASYELRVGFNYSVSGKPEKLKKGETLTIPPFEVAVIEFLETINMPDFLIGRWNIRTRWAYKGLVWVGGPQVNPGYRGLIMAPIWNLSKNSIEIEFGEALAVMDFSTTSNPTVRSNGKPPWNKRSRHVFGDYRPEELQSGLVDLVHKAVKTNEGLSVEIEKSRARIDSVTGVMFTALGVLTTAVTILVTRPAGYVDWWEPNILWLGACTTIIALLAWVKASSQAKTGTGLMAFVVVLALIFLGLNTYSSLSGMRTVSDQGKKLREINAQVNSLIEQNKRLSQEVKEGLKKAPAVHYPAMPSAMPDKK